MPRRVRIAGLDPLHLAGDVLLGVVVGALGGLFGIGGGLIAIPILGVLYNLDEQHAQGTAMVMVAPNVFVGLYHYVKRGGFDRRLALAAAIAAVPFTALAAFVAVHAQSGVLRRGFAIFLAAIGIFFLVRTLMPIRPRTMGRAPWPVASAIGALGGTLSGLFGVGGAVFAVPLLSIAFGLAQAAAQGLGLALVAPGTLVAVTTYAVEGDVVWQIGIPLALGGIVAVKYGVALAYRLPDRALRLLFVVLLFGSATALWVKA